MRGRVQSIAINDAIAEVPPSGKALNRGRRFEEVALRAIDSPKSEVVEQSSYEVDGGVPASDVQHQRVDEGISAHVELDGEVRSGQFTPGRVREVRLRRDLEDLGNQCCALPRGAGAKSCGISDTECASACRSMMEMSQLTAASSLKLLLAGKRCGALICRDEVRGQGTNRARENPSQ